MRSFTYDDENQLTRITWGGGSYRTDFVYDGLQRLRKRIETWWNGSAWQVTSETWYVYDGRRVIQERNSSNTPTVSYTRGNDLSGSLEGAGGIGGLLARSSGFSGGNWTTHHCYHADGNGNITAMVDSTQALSASYRYDPYGNLITSSGSMAGQNMYRFSSKEFFGSINVYYFGYRFYDANLQRWLNRDPAGEEGGINLFAYVANDSINQVDPFGYRPESMPMPGKIFPAHPASTDADTSQVGRVNTGNAPPAYPRPSTNLKPCSKEGDVRKVSPSFTGGYCPCTHVPIKCFSYERCEPAPVSAGLNGVNSDLRRVPHTLCYTKCPEGVYSTLSK